MKSIITAIIAILSFSLSGQNYIMFTTVTMDPNPSKIKDLRLGLTEFKAKFHKDNTPYQATIYRIINGPNSGKFVWLEGPQKYADFDHYSDLGEGYWGQWETKIEVNCASMGKIEYWKQWSQYSRSSQNPGSLVVVKYLNVNTKDKQGFRINGLFEKMSKAIKSVDGDFSWGVYSNELEQGSYGRHFAIVTDYKSFQDMDDNINEFGQRSRIRQAFNKIYGEGSHQRFLDEWRDVFSNSYDEIQMVMDL